MMQVVDAGFEHGEIQNNNMYSESRGMIGQVSVPFYRQVGESDSIRKFANLPK